MSTDYEILRLSGEAYLVFQGGLAVFANDAAGAFWAESPEGQRFEALFSLPWPEAENTGIQAEVSLPKGAAVLLLRRNGDRALALLRRVERAPLTPPDPLLVLLRDAQSDIMLSSHRMLEATEDADRQAVQDASRNLLRGQFRLDRLLTAAMMRDNLSAGQQVFRPALCDVSALTRSVLEAVRYSLPQLRLEEELPDTLSAPVDTALFKQLLFHLLSNSLEAGASLIRVALRPGREDFVLLLRDDGEGMNSEELMRAFDRSQHPFRLSELRRGPGMGLQICRGIAALHGGTLLLESAEGQGCTVRVSFRTDLPYGERLCTPEDAACTAEELFSGLAELLPREAFDYRMLE